MTRQNVARTFTLPVTAGTPRSVVALFWKAPPAVLPHAQTSRPWALHPGLTWADALRAVGMTQADAARRLGVSAKHLNQVIRGHVLPSAALTVRFAELVETSPRLLWQLRCNYELALAMGADDVTPPLDGTEAACPTS